MGYIDNPNMVRVDLFKGSGKWYCTVSLNWDRYRSVNAQDGSEDVEDIRSTFYRCMASQFQNRFSGLTAVCLEPYHEHEHPLMIFIP